MTKDDSRTNGFGLNLGPSVPEGSDPWRILFPEDPADEMTLTSESDSEERPMEGRRRQRPQEALRSWDNAIGQLTENAQNQWALDSGIHSAENSDDENEEDAGEGGSTPSSDSTARMYDVAPLFSNSSDFGHPSSSYQSDDEQHVLDSYMNSEEDADAEDPEDMPMEEDEDVEDYQLIHPNQQHILEAYKQFHRVPAPRRHCVWVTRTWESPAFVSDLDEGIMSPQEKTLHQRGIPLDMQDKFQIAYTNRLGLSVQLGRGNVIFLGWNVTIFWNMGDRTGEVFMAYIRWEMSHHAERWKVHVHPDGCWDAHRLRCICEETGQNAYASLEEQYTEESDD